MGKKIKKYKVGTDSETYAISMVEEPAIEVDYVALAKQEEEVSVKLASDERHICYGPALIPNKDIYRNNGEQEFYINFTEESIVKMSQDFMKEYRQKEVTLDHETDADEVYIVESWLVEDPYRDKAAVLGFNVPKNTWMIAMKVNNIEVWDRVKAGELKGFSVESLISLEEFSKEDKIDNNMTIETNDMGFWNKMKEILEECFSSSKFEEPTEIEPINEDLEAEPQPEPVVEPSEPQTEPEPTTTKVEENNEPVEPTSQEPKQEEEPKVEEPVKDNHLEELINNLKEEIAALKTSNGELQEKIKEMGKTPSAQPVNVHSKPSAGDTYSAWREQMRHML